MSKALVLALFVCAAISGTVSAQDAAAAESDADIGALYAAPTVPSFCSSKQQHTQKYQQGVTKGTQKANDLFASAEIGKNPQKLTKKLNRVLERLFDNVKEAWRGEAKDNKRCRVQGVADGFISRIVELLGQCILDGAQWGQFAANMYCSLSLETGGLGDTGVFVRAPVGLCGTLFQSTCDGVYTYVATEGQKTMTSTVQKFCTDRAISVQPYAGCRVYTEGNFSSVFSNSRAADCVY